MSALLRLFFGGLVLAIGGSFITASAASITVPPSAAGQSTFAVTANALAPAQCSSLVLTAIVSGNGAINGAVGAVNELITGGAGVDTINGDGGDDCILAGGGEDTVNGGDGGDVVLGDGGDDQLNGDAGADALYGGAGAGDVCTGGTELDTFPGGSCETEVQ